ncbi:MAG: type II secretion system protein [Phycisphaerales bacterium]|nr:MAG: type II secretion system protein [Phycisphaerales bacterium]
MRGAPANGREAAGSGRTGHEGLERSLVPGRVETSATHHLHRLPVTGAVRAFTLIETLIVMSIIAVLLAILLPALNSARQASKAIVCTANMKTVVMEFGFFAEGTSAGGRGDSESLGGDKFRINDFLDSLYQLDEFWDRDEDSVGTLKSGNDLALCPAGAPRLTKRKGYPCGREAVGPVEDVSIAVNMRLYRAVFEVKDMQLLASPSATHVSPRILRHPYVPLILDVDGQEAAQKGVDPFYIAPALKDVEDPYTTGRYWSPSTRHGGKTVVGFVGGHVLSSTQPDEEHWDWSYQGELGR